MQRHLAGVGIDLHLADVAAVGEGVERRRVGGVLVEAGLHAGRQPRRLERRTRHVLQRYRAIGARDAEPAVGELDVGLGRLQQVRGDSLALVDHLLCGERQRGTADHHRARSVRTHAKCDAVGVAVDELHFLRVDAEAVAQDLLEDSFVPLSVRLCAHQQDRTAARLKPDFRVFGRRSGGLLDRVGEAEATQHATRTRCLAPRREARAVGRFQSASPCSG